MPFDRESHNVTEEGIAPAPASDVSGGRRPLFARGRSRAPKVWALFAVVAAAWLALDAVTKQIASAHSLGSVYAVAIPDVLQLRLVHNFGAAWSMFAGSTVLLGSFAIVVLAICLIVLARFAAQMTLIEAVGAGLLFAGGIGNALDRFLNGFVVDFIQVLFIDFPVFNVADIGITCGIALLASCLIVRIVREENGRGDQSTSFSQDARFERHDQKGE